MALDSSSVNCLAVIFINLCMKEKYSVAICPPVHIVDAVAALKERLASNIGWFNSKNAKAHITINTFEIQRQDDIEAVKSYLKERVQYECSGSLVFSSFATYPNGAFFLAPNVSSKVFLQKMFSRCNAGFPLPAIKSRDPHLSIARRLDENQIGVAYDLFTSEADLHFVCDRICLRKFDQNKKQYSIESEYLFREETNLFDAKVQLSLFD